MPDQHHSEEDTGELPRLLNTWPKMYAFVIANLLVLMLLFYWLTKAFE
ncbi:MAG: hypothetical protein MUD08_17370 [Cytophagales bacterium]|jgi:hypothetical protein|nr:hypothetical protein [Cytophagales bacterium]